MQHLVIGAAQAAHVREYARSYELATGARPHLVGWEALCVEGEAGSALSPGGPRGQLIVRLAAPTAQEVAAIQALGGAPPAIADGEAAQAGLTGLLRACSLLDQRLVAEGCSPRYATSPSSLALLADRALRARALERDGVPQPAVWGLLEAEEPDVNQSAVHRAYEALRDRLRRTGRRAVVRLSRGLLQVPTVVVWMGGRGLRAQANCRFTQQGMRRAAVHMIEEEAGLRPLIGRLFELGAVVQEDWPCAEVNGRPFSLHLLVVRGRVVLGRVGHGAIFQPPEPPGALPELALLKAQIGRPLYEAIEQACVRLALVFRCAGLVLEVGVTRRFDGFAVLDVDPFAELGSGVRDAVGWSASDHLVRGVRTLPLEEPSQYDAATGPSPA